MSHFAIREPLPNARTLAAIGELYTQYKTLSPLFSLLPFLNLFPYVHISIFSPPPVVVVVVDLHIFYSLPLSLPLLLSAVHKFRRRPQYLEFFVHLASAGMEQGLHHLVPEWAHETFTWLARQVNVQSIVCVRSFFTQPYMRAHKLTIKTFGEIFKSNFSHQTCLACTCV